MARSTRAARTSQDEPEALPKWAEDEIKSVNFEDPQIVSRTGYILDIYEKDFKVDIQVYEPLPDGRTIVEGLDVLTNMKISEFMKGFVYEFKIKMYKGKLSSQLADLLKSKYVLEMDSIYRFEMEDLQMLDVESDVAKSSNESSADSDDDTGD
ncbi:MAG: hypothetical protein GEU26_01980 [Nitrososphaeraceae archaeon]|nr:hypothetical protein [Nitrososphaeraceae archaeon]